MQGYSGNEIASVLGVSISQLNRLMLLYIMSYC